MTTVFLDVPEDLARVAAAHGAAVATADNATVLADFMPDRVGQLIVAADVPTGLTSSEVRSITEAEPGAFDVVIRYHASGDEWFELRSRWGRHTDGSWRVFAVRNIPDTPPWVKATVPAADGSDAPHWDGLRAGVLVLQRCSDCGHWIWAPRPICPRCHSFAVEWAEVEAVGTVYSWTRTWQQFTPEVTGHLPYVVVLVQLAGSDDCRVIGALEGADGITPRIGATVRGTVVPAPDDTHWPLLRWHLEALS